MSKDRTCINSWIEKVVAIECFRMNLKTMVQAIPKRNNEFVRIAAVVKRDSWFKNLKDLKGAKACFTGYRDVGEYIPIF